MLGLIPYIKFDKEVAAMPYMTRDFIKMKEQEIKLATSWKTRWFLTFYIYFVQLANMTLNRTINHLQRRGIFFCYWVINQEGEILHLVKTSNALGFMTDRPSFIKPYLRAMYNDQVKK